MKIWPPGVVLVPILATTWRHLHKLETWPPVSNNCISYKFDSLTVLALVANLVTGGGTCISWKFGHRVMPLALVQ